MTIQPLLGFIVARLITGRKISTLIDSQTGEQFTYSQGEQIYDYKRSSYASVTKEESGSIKVYDYKTKQYYMIKSKSNGLFVAYILGAEKFFEITVNSKWVIIMSESSGSSKIYYIQ